jgi:hypothetical protein
VKNWQTIAKCNACGVEKIKRKDEYSPATYLCTVCFRKKRGKDLGEKYGKSQKYKGSCKGCKKMLPTSIKY